MGGSPLSDDDHELVERGRAIIRDRVEAGRHHVGAGVRTKSGEVYTAVHLETEVGRAAVCAEPIAIGMAIADGAPEVDTIVAVHHDAHAEDVESPSRVVPPCGICRELIYDYGPDASVIVAPDGSCVKRPIEEMLPEKQSY